MKIKRIILTIFCCAILLTACNFFEEEKGLVRLTFNESSTSSRAINGSTGLPYIKEMDVKIEAEDLLTGEKTEAFYNKHNLDDVSIYLSISHKYRISVKLYSPVAIWKGSTEHAVKNGVNILPVEIKRKARGLNVIGYTVKPSLTSPTEKNLTIHLPDGTEFTKVQFEYSNFCCDEKGRFYIPVKTGSSSEFSLYRYDSEGQYVDSKTDLNGMDVYSMAYDRVTGTPYILMNEVQSILCPIDSSLSLTSGIDFGGDALAVYDNVAISVRRGNMTTPDPRIKCVKKTSGSWGSVDGVSTQAAFVKDSITDEFMQKHPIGKGVIVNDIFMDANSIYLLVSDEGQGKSSGSNLIEVLQYQIQTGCILKIDYSVKGAKLNLSNPQFFGIGELISIPTSRILPASYYANNFYKPVKFIGFDGDNLYIADDGKQYEFSNTGGVKFKANVNRIATFNLADKSLSFEMAPENVKWDDGE